MRAATLALIAFALLRNDSCNAETAATPGVRGAVESSVQKEEPQYAVDNDSLLKHRGLAQFTRTVPMGVSFTYRCDPWRGSCQVTEKDWGEARIYESSGDLYDCQSPNGCRIMCDISCAVFRLANVNPAGRSASGATVNANTKKKNKNTATTGGTTDTTTTTSSSGPKAKVQTGQTVVIGGYVYNIQPGGRISGTTYDSSNNGNKNTNTNTKNYNYPSGATVTVNVQKIKKKNP